MERLNRIVNTCFRDLAKFGKIFFPLILLITACEKAAFDAGVDENEGEEQPVTQAPVKTLPGNGAGFQPAFVGQTRIDGVKTNTAIETTLLIADAAIYKPWSFKFISNSAILLAQKDGNMRIIRFGLDGVSIGEPITGLPTDLFFDVRELGAGANSSNAGLFDIALDPNFTINHLIYFSYSKGIGPANRLTICKANLVIEENRLVNVKEIYQVSQDHAGNSVYGGRLVFDQAGYLMVTTGERNRHDSHYMAQNLNSSIGKVLRLDKEGSAAPGNPFEGVSGALPEIWALGIRSPLGLAFHPATGVLWETEHGPKGGDELNMIEAGKNYGWPIISYGINYDSTPVGQGILPVPDSGFPWEEYRFEMENLIGGGITTRNGMEQPRYYWDPCIAPGGIAFYSGNVISEWNNDLFIAGLASKYLTRLVIEGNKVVGEERFMEDVGVRLRDVQQGPDGALYVITDTKEGRIYRIGKPL
ncbi:PQQ-dependent sugar dehydrogenase [Parapedobacter sp. 10938]|uniref:PQQ-dependent sugar dehydrogenase n=1 Tax=Parapedobacter flavus TaxID=3110225 RepID=UPI002DBE787A|nr:PQQ-dependent sugar dehydrogenase [Parapedobacter sp. 10938]MEC3879902.1 PQQ-dependent sugar dehydrogenase [Parapedobacter sp. 10938]